MIVSNRLAVFAAVFAMLAAPIGVSAESRHYTHHRHFVREASSCPLHRTADGTLVDCQGWRKRDNAVGWDNTCLNFDYLPSMYACSGGRR